MQQDNVGALVERASFDEVSANILLQHGGHEAIIGFHYQQAVEKLLKAVLIRLNANPPKTHNIVLLKQLLEDAGEALPPEFADLDLLNPYAVSERYGYPGINSPLDMQGAREMVSRVRTWDYGLLGLPDTPPNP